MKKLKVTSIRKPHKCYMCDGTGIEYYQYEKEYHRVCGVCDGKKYTKFRLNFKIHNLELEAMICNRHGSINKYKWCVEVCTSEKVSDSNKADYAGVYENGDTVSIHHYMQDGWGKSIEEAYNHAIKNVENKFVFNESKKEFELKK